MGFTLPAGADELYRKIPERVWTPAYSADGDLRDGADVAEFTSLLKLEGWPTGMRVIVRRERPHPGAQLRLDDPDGYRLTAFATNTPVGQLPDLELRHRLRARCEDRIRCAKDTGLAALPFKSFNSNRIWCQIVALACDILAWAQMLALGDHPARRWEPKTIRHRLLNIPAVLVRHARRTTIRYKQDHPWASLLTHAISSLHALAAP